MNKIYNDLRLFNKSATDSSIKMYSNNIIIISKSLGYNIDDIKPSIFKNIDDVLDLLKSQSLNTQKNKLVSILVYLQSQGYDAKIIDKYNNMIYSLLGKLKIETDKNEWDDREIKKGAKMSVDELVLLSVNLKKELGGFNNIKDFFKYMDYIILSLNLKFPLRNDWAEMKMIQSSEYDKLKDKTQFNYMVIDSNDIIKFYINKYKTVKSHGVIKFNSSDKELNNIIISYYENVKKFYNQNNKIFENWLLFKRDLEPMTRVYYSKYLMDIFYKHTGFKITASILRKIITSSLINIKAFKSMAALQGHTVSEAMAAYSKS